MQMQANLHFWDILRSLLAGSGGSEVTALPNITVADCE
jgi:hypothetical protein